MQKLLIDGGCLSVYPQPGGFPAPSLICRRLRLLFNMQDRSLPPALIGHLSIEELTCWTGLPWTEVRQSCWGRPPHTHHHHTERLTTGLEMELCPRNPLNPPLRNLPQVSEKNSVLKIDRWDRNILTVKDSFCSHQTTFKHSRQTKRRVLLSFTVSDVKKVTIKKKKSPAGDWSDTKRSKHEQH